MNYDKVQYTRKQVMRRVLIEGVNYAVRHYMNSEAILDSEIELKQLWDKAQSLQSPEGEPLSEEYASALNDIEIFLGTVDKNVDDLTDEDWND